MDLLNWHFAIEEIIAGAVGGLAYAIFRDDVILPSVSGRKVLLGCFRAIALGAFVGFIVDTHPAFSALMGFSFNDVIKAIQTKLKHWLEVDANADANSGGGDKNA